MKNLVITCDLCGDPAIHELLLGGKSQDCCEPCLNAMRHFSTDRLAWAPVKVAAEQRIADEQANVKTTTILVEAP